ncbi:hypothetical protein DFH94DRAFT_852528 [Russula ochroleuca]|uniref:Alfy-like armadillo-like repeat domain-containing protein n=1 Tax=Russula ochroleuca TaxID=152965 RepID=A0A9P5MY87_9AGAM|nr:hypothetical protein DFH94DRAFT_852528 [Russula ochroleuca]
MSSPTRFDFEPSQGKAFACPMFLFEGADTVIEFALPLNKALSALLITLRARFETAPQVEAVTTPTTTNADDIAPEDLSHDVLIELMRIENAVEKLKTTGDICSQVEVGILCNDLAKDACTKDVFREMDGFLAVINILSTLRVYREENLTSER